MNTDNKIKYDAQSCQIAVKSRFFAQYWGQRVGVKDKFENWIVGKVLGLNFECLELKPLSKITDKEALKVGEIEHWNDPRPEACKNHILNMILFKRGAYNVEVTDYLRSKGYALPFMEYSVDDLISIGWVRLA